MGLLKSEEIYRNLLALKLICESNGLSLMRINFKHIDQNKILHMIALIILYAA